MAYRESQGPEEGGAGEVVVEEETKTYMVMELVVEIHKRRSNHWAVVPLSAQDGNLEDVSQQTQFRMDHRLQLHPYKQMPRSFARVRTMCNGQLQLGAGRERHQYQDSRIERHHAHGEDRLSSRLLPI